MPVGTQQDSTRVDVRHRFGHHHLDPVRPGRQPAGDGATAGQVEEHTAPVVLHLGDTAGPVRQGQCDMRQPTAQRRGRTGLCVADVQTGGQLQQIAVDVGELQQRRHQLPHRGHPLHRVDQGQLGVRGGGRAHRRRPSLGRVRVEQLGRRPAEQVARELPPEIHGVLKTQVDPQTGQGIEGVRRIPDQEDPLVLETVGDPGRATVPADPAHGYIGERPLVEPLHARPQLRGRGRHRSARQIGVELGGDHPGHPRFDRDRRVQTADRAEPGTAVDLLQLSEIDLHIGHQTAIGLAGTGEADPRQLTHHTVLAVGPDQITAAQPVLAAAGPNGDRDTRLVLREPRQLVTGAQIRTELDRPALQLPLHVLLPEQQRGQVPVIQRSAVQPQQREVRALRGRGVLAYPVQQTTLIEKFGRRRVQSLADGTAAVARGMALQHDRFDAPQAQFVGEHEPGGPAARDDDGIGHNQFLGVRGLGKPDPSWPG